MRITWRLDQLWRSRLLHGKKTCSRLSEKTNTNRITAWVDYVNTLIQSMPLNKIENDIVKIADSLKPHSSRNEGFNVIWECFDGNKTNTKSVIVHRLNTRFYPGSANGRYLLQMRT
ncbi:MAG TPA: hypothetical protein VKA49_23315 [Flavitalea sp.]|nr:hypothetical protein [Flavitalea sp.]